MKLACYNVENLFTRAVALNPNDPTENRDALERQVRLNTLFAKSVYSAADKKSMLQLLEGLGLLYEEGSGKLAVLRQNRGQLLARRRDGSVEIVANGRSSWLGSVELKSTDVNEGATRGRIHRRAAATAARVINELNADVIALAEAESQPALVRFSHALNPANGAARYEHITLVDGHDQRGIDVALMSKADYPITATVNRLGEQHRDGPTSDQGAAVYSVRTPKQNSVTVLVNHFKSREFGVRSVSDQKRNRQAWQAKKIYETLVKDGHELVAVIGDLGEPGDFAPLAPLLRHTDLRDISGHPGFEKDSHEAFDQSGSAEKIAYILLSPALFALTRRGAVLRTSACGVSFDRPFEYCRTRHRKCEDRTPEHAAIWAEIEV
jgi:hypothetical protein